MKNAEWEQLFNEYISLRVGQKNENIFKKPVVIAFIALNGTGKSFFAKKLSESLGNMPISCNDFVRRFLESKGLSGDGENESPRHFLATKESDYFYKNKISHIIDADLIKWYQDTQKEADRYGFNLLMIHIICPEDMVIQRIEKRFKEISLDPTANYSRVNTDEYFVRKELHKKLGLPKDFFATIDSSKDLDIQIELFIKKLKKENFL